jgi:hypothetical protein
VRYREEVTLRSSRIVLAAALLLAGCASPSVTPSTSSAPPSEAEPTPFATPTPTIPTVPAWRELPPSGDTPAAREDHTWTVTPDAATAYLFGGRTGEGEALGDLWAYDLPGNSWTIVTEDGPPARFGHNAAWVDGVGLVIFAGQAGATFYNDLWAFDPAANAWTELPAGGAAPVPRYGSCAAIGPDGRLWISHGFTQEGQRFADTRAYDFSTSQWTDETPAGDAPIQRCLHACWWAEDGTFVLYAGQTTGTNSLADLWWLTVGERPGTNTWAEQVPDGLPPARNLYAAARWGPATVVFGGQGLDGNALTDTWQLSDDGSSVQSPIAGTVPQARWAAELIADPSRGRLLLFGGRNDEGARNDVWELTDLPDE